MILLGEIPHALAILAASDAPELVERLVPRPEAPAGGPMEWGPPIRGKY